MVAVPAHEHLNSLLTTYQYAEKIYSQMVSDVIAAELRRDEAERFKIDALEKLQKAREIFSPNGTDIIKGETKGSVPHEKLSEAAKEGSSMNPVIERTIKPSRKGPETSETEFNSRPDNQLTRSVSATELESSSVTPMQLPLEGTRNELILTPSSIQGKPLLSKSSLPAADKELLSPRRPIKASIAQSNATKPLLAAPPISATEGNNEKLVTSPPVTRAASMVSRTKPPIHEGHVEGTTRNKTRGVVVALKAYNQPKPTLQVTKGRSREWLEKNFNYEAFGLVKKFYQASVGTKTNEKTQKVTIRTILLSDEWNDLATDTSMIQEMYVIKGTGENNSGGGPGQRDRAAHALVDPPHALPIALFFAPKRTLNNSDIYYVGHWKVVDGEVFDPPVLVNGHLRQAMAKLAFAGVDRNIVDAFNRDV